jgi:two-component system, LuxR family, sensor kinase FixL
VPAKKFLPAAPAYRKVLADLRTCEERYERMVDSAAATTETRLKSALETLQSELKQRRRLESELLTAVETERQRIGQDLHDDLCQRLGAAAIMAAVLAKRIDSQDPEIARELQKIPKLINDTIDSCRTLARGLHPVTLAAKGLPAALEELASKMPTDIHFRWPQGKRIALDQATALHLYRITEEAVGNAVRHAKAARIIIELKVIGRETVLSISDDGIGFDETLTSDGMGLRNMQYRAGAIGAALTILRRKGGGMQVCCRVPMRPKTKKEP